MNFNYSTPVKDSQSHKKTSKSHNQSHNQAHNQTREGDWLCLNCNNVNFSFRKKCNRCKTQTRKQNEDLQNAYTLYFYNQHQANLYNYDTHLYPQSVNDPVYYVAEVKPEPQRKHSFNETHQNTLKNSKNYFNQQQDLIKITLTSPLKHIANDVNPQNSEHTNKKLRTPSSKKKRTLKKKNDLLPSVSPLLKKLLAKEDTNSKSHLSNHKDSLNVALFYDQIWDNNKENIPQSQNQFQDTKPQLCFTNSAKKLNNSRMLKTNDSTTLNTFDEDGFAFYLKSPEKDEGEDEIIEIDDGDDELAQIISKIII